MRSIGLDQNGFTLIELLVVTVVIGVLGTIFLATHYQTALQRARDGKKISRLAKTSLNLEVFFDRYGRYPAADPTGKIISCEAGGTLEACDWEDGTFYYRTGPNGLAWQLYAWIEYKQNQSIDNNGDGQYIPADDDYLFTNCGISACNYGFSSSNITPSLQDLSAL
jgi:prepilin-type N-terminal cleavage/methylation domain-containing protein